MFATQSPLPQYFDIDGDPLDLGSLYFGTASQNPETNPITVYWDLAGTQPALQPVRTLNGFAARNGTPAQIYANSDYSINVRNKKGVLVEYAANAVSFSNSLALQLALADTASAANGAGMSGFNGSLNYVGLTIGARLLDIGASPRSLGAVSDGIADDTTFVQACLLYSKTLDLRNRTWKISSTIALPAGVSIDMRGATILAACGATPLLSFTGAKAGLYINGGGGVVAGTASHFLLAQGSTNQPSSIAHYARFVMLEGVTVSDPNIALFIELRDASNQVFLNKCSSSTPNGILMNGKCVETHISTSIIFGTSGAAGTYGIKAISTGGTNKYNEGLHVTNSTVDGFEKPFDIYDMFVMTVSNSYVGGTATGYSFDFHPPSTTTLNEEANIGSNCVIAGRIRFQTFAAGAYNAKVNGAIMLAGTAIDAIEIQNNASAITVSDITFRNGAGSTGVHTSGAGNNSIVCSNLTFDGTYLNGVKFDHTGGVNCAIGPLFGAVTGEMWQHPAALLVRKTGIPIATAVQTALWRQYNTADLAGTYAVGVNIVSLVVNLAKGEKGVIDIQFPCSGMNAATQLFQLTPPAGMRLPGFGTGAWAAEFIYPSAASGLITASIPYYVDTDIAAGTLLIKNQAGNTVTLQSHGRFGIARDF